MDHHDIYREQLTGLHRGHALWEPDIHEQQVEIGDVGFVNRGRFERLFNVYLPRDHRSHTLGAPEDFVPLAPIPTVELALPPGDYCSASVECEALNVGAQIAATRGSGSGSGSARASFKCPGRQGAVLSLPFEGTRKDARVLTPLRTHILKNCHSWFAFAQAQRIGIRSMEDIILVTGFDLGESCALAAFTTAQPDAEFVFDASLPVVGSPALRWTAHQHNSSGVRYNYGPQTNHVPEAKQCLFVRGYRAKGRASSPIVQEAGMMFRDPVVAVLDYVLQRFPHAELAIAHDDDLRNIHIDHMSSKPSQFRAQGHLSAANVIKHLEGIYGTTPVDVQPSRKVVQLIDVFMHCGEAGSTKQPGEDPRNGSTPLSKSQHPGSRRNGKYACTTCQKRKTKCEPRGDGVPCQSCQIQNVACSFVAHAEGVDVQRIAPRPETNRREVRREKYAPQACTSCRQRKSKCDGNQPVCGPCVQRGCEKQCTWGANGTANSACPSVVVHSLQQKNAALEKRIAMLEARIASPTEAASQVDLYEDNSSPVVFSTSRFGAGVKKQEPDDPDIEQLTAPMNHLHLRDDDLQLFGPTSILRLAPRKLEPLRTSREREMEESTYVLYGHTEIDWARHLPSDVCLSQYEHDKLLYLFFYCFSSWCLRVIPESFLRDMHCALRRPKDLPVPRTTHYSPMLHNAILALSAAFSDVPAVKAPGARKRFADKAMECLESEGERPSMSAVLALSILSNYHSSRGSPTLGYIYFGISARIAQSLGLGIDCTKWVEDGVISETDMQDRNWVFWATFCQDTCFSLYVGRDFGVHSVVDYGRIPIPFSDVNPGRWPWNDGPEQRPSYLGETFASACKLMVIAREIVDVVSNFTRLSVRQDANDEDIRKMDLKLTQWRENTPAEVGVSERNSTGLPHQLMLSMAYYWLAIVLHRPFYCRKPVRDQQGFEMDHVKICNKAAVAIMDLAKNWQNLYSLRFGPITFVQVVPAAGTVFILDALQAASFGPSPSLETACERVEYTISCLRSIGESFVSAGGMADILQSLLDHQVMMRLQRWQEQLPLGPLPAMEQEYDMVTPGQASWDSQYYNTPLHPVNTTYPYQQTQDLHSHPQVPVQEWWNAQLGYQPYGFSTEAANIGFPGINMHGGVGMQLGGDGAFASNPFTTLAAGESAFPGYDQVQIPQEEENQDRDDTYMQQGFASFG